MQTVSKTASHNEDDIELKKLMHKDYISLRNLINYVYTVDIEDLTQ